MVSQFVQFFHTHIFSVETFSCEPRCCKDYTKYFLAFYLLFQHMCQMLQVLQHNQSTFPTFVLHCLHFKGSIFLLIDQVSNKHISTSLLGIHIKISASPLISAAPLNVVLIRVVTIFY